MNQLVFLLLLLKGSVVFSQSACKVNEDCEKGFLCGEENQCVLDFFPCATILCGPGFQCNPLLGECVGDTCETAVNPCKEGYSCVNSPSICDQNTPFCPQFECEENRCPLIKCSSGFECQEPGECVPIKNKNDCETDCGEIVPSFSFFEGDGENYCKTCFCWFGRSFCFPYGKCKPNEKEESCEEEVTCFTSCGVPVEVGKSFQDDGRNFCNTCACQENGFSICTLIACDQQDERSFCENEEFCETECGVKFRVGEEFTDDGENYCNECTCEKGGFKSCTEKACIESPKSLCVDEEEPATCKTQCGRSIPVGESFQDDGPNFCNTCTCTEGGFAACTRRACDQKDERFTCSECDKRNVCNKGQTCVETLSKQGNKITRCLDECDKKGRCKNPQHYTCDDLTNLCEPIDCGAENACAPGEECVSLDRICVRTPCPQFTCEA